MYILINNDKNYLYRPSGHINEINYIDILEDKHDSSDVIKKSEF